MEFHDNLDALDMLWPKDNNEYAIVQKRDEYDLFLFIFYIFEGCYGALYSKQ